MVELCPLADGDDDGQVAEGHHNDGQKPGEGEKVDKVNQLNLLVGDGDGVHALLVVPDDRVCLQAEDERLRNGAEDGHTPGGYQKPPSAVHRRAMGYWEHNGAESESNHFPY